MWDDTAPFHVDEIAHKKQGVIGALGIYISTLPTNQK